MLRPFREKLSLLVPSCTLIFFQTIVNMASKRKIRTPFTVLPTLCAAILSTRCWETSTTVDNLGSSIIFALEDDRSEERYHIMDDLSVGRTLSCPDQTGGLALSFSTSASQVVRSLCAPSNIASQAIRSSCAAFNISACSSRSRCIRAAFRCFRSSMTDAC